MTDKPGPTGEYPQGKLGSDDDGELTIAFSYDHGNIRIDFGTPTEWIAMSPEHARELANLLRYHADVVAYRVLDRKP
jgi:hypothetical protein